MPRIYLKKVILSKQVRRADFLRFMPARQKKELLKQASGLRGKRVAHINAVADGGGVAEILARDCRQLSRRRRLKKRPPGRKLCTFNNGNNTNFMLKLEYK